MRPGRRLFLLAAALFLAAPPAAGEGLRAEAEAAGIALGVAAGPRQIRDHPGKIAADFSSLTPENALKWGELAKRSPRYDFRTADAMVAFAEANGLRLRGHALLWSRLNGMPDWLRRHIARAPDAAAELRRLAAAHIALVVGRYAGRVAQWDVVNEPLAARGGELDAENPFVRLGGEAFLAEAFQLAAAADPAAELFLNEYMAEADDARFAALEALVARLLAAGAPVHGVGLQGHFAAVPDGAKLRERIERLGALGVTVEITELDLPLRLFAAAEDPLAAQANGFRTVVEACRAVPACAGVTVWGLGDGDSWLGRAAQPLLLDARHRPKPAHRAVREALLARAESRPRAGGWPAQAGGLTFR